MAAPVFSSEFLAALGSFPDDMKKLIQVLQVAVTQLPQAPPPSEKAVDRPQKSVVGATPVAFDASISQELLDKMTKDKADADVIQRGLAYIEGAVTALMVFG